MNTEFFLFLVINIQNLYSIVIFYTHFLVQESSNIS